MTKRGLFLGRFQPPHHGHMEALQTISEEIDRLLIVVGSSQYSHTEANPFTAGERVWMLEECLAEIGLPATIIPVPDIHRNSLWVSHVETFVPPFEVCYMNNPLPSRLFREAGYDVRGFELVDRDRYQATQVRKLMLEGGDWQARVPDPVARIVEQIDGIERLREVTSSDTSPATEELMTEPPYEK